MSYSNERLSLGDFTRLGLLHSGSLSSISQTSQRATDFDGLDLESPAGQCTAVTDGF
jgi:hypothetical protein